MKIKSLVLCTALLFVLSLPVTAGDCEDGQTPVGGRQCLIASPEPAPVEKYDKSEPDTDVFSALARWLKTFFG